VLQNNDFVTRISGAGVELDEGSPLWPYPEDYTADFDPPDYDTAASAMLDALRASTAKLAPAQLGRFQRDRGAPSVQGIAWLPLEDIAGVEIHPPHVKDVLLNGLPDALTFWPEE
jgi:hypothetical protein